MNADELIVALARNHKKLHFCPAVRLIPGSKKAQLEYLIVTYSGQIVARRVDIPGAGWLLVYGNHQVPISDAIFNFDPGSNHACALLSTYS